MQNEITKEELDLINQQYLNPPSPENQLWYIDIVDKGERGYKRPWAIQNDIVLNASQYQEFKSKQNNMEWDYDKEKKEFYFYPRKCNRTELFNKTAIDVLNATDYKVSSDRKQRLTPDELEALKPLENYRQYLRVIARLTNKQFSLIESLKGVTDKSIIDDINRQLKELDVQLDAELKLKTLKTIDDFQGV